MRFTHLKIPVAILLAISALFFPFWITFVLFLLGTFFLQNFYFGMFVLFFMDAIYALEGVKLGPFYGMLTIGGILVFVLMQVIKERMFNME